MSDGSVACPMSCSTCSPTAPYAGNPLAVVMDADELSGAQMLHDHPPVQPLRDGVPADAERGRASGRRRLRAPDLHARL